MDYRIGITGAQGSGKTTLAKFIDEHYGIPYVDAGVGALMTRLGVNVGDPMPLFERLQVQMEVIPIIRGKRYLYHRICWEGQ